MPVDGSLKTPAILEKALCSTNSNNSHRVEWVTLRKVSKTVTFLHSVPFLKTPNYTHSGGVFLQSSKCDEFFCLGRKISIDVTQWLYKQPHDIISTLELPGCFFRNGRMIRRQRSRRAERKGSQTQLQVQGVKHPELWHWAGSWAIYKIFLGWYTESLKWDKAWWGRK